MLKVITILLVALGIYVQLSGIYVLEHSPESNVKPGDFVRYSEREFGYWDRSNVTGLFMYFHVAEPEENVEEKGIVIYAHGYGGDSINSVGTTLRDKMLPLGYIFASMDQEGFGRSAGDRSHLISFPKRVQEFSEYIQTLKKRYPGLPVFLFGSSLGCISATGAALENPDELAGVVLLAPAFETTQHWIIQNIAKTLRLFIPKFSVNAIDKKVVSRDIEKYNRYIKSYKFNQDHITLNAAGELFSYRDAIFARLKEIHVPVYIGHGSADQTTLPEGSEKVFNSISSEDKTLDIYPGAYHDLVLDPESEKIWKTVETWITSHTN